MGKGKSSTHKCRFGRGPYVIVPGRVSKDREDFEHTSFLYLFISFLDVRIFVGVTVERI